MESRVGGQGFRVRLDGPAEEPCIMLRSLADLRSYAIHALDGEIGTVHDLLFDDREWTIRYLVVDTGAWFPGRKVLISPISFRRASWDSRRARVMLTRDQIRDGPGVESGVPMSRQEEERLTEYYAWPVYWSMSPNPPAIPTAFQAEPARQADELQAGTPADDSHLRSLRAVVGYRIEAREGSIGYLEDLIGDDADWLIRYMVVDMRDRLPGKRALPSPAWIDGVDWSTAQVRLDLDKERIENAPAYDPSVPISREYETRLHDFYGMPLERSGEPQNPWAGHRQAGDRT